MQICHSIAALRAARGALTGRVGFVPTMGALHEGHLTLMRLAAQRCDHVITSIFVNPTQFGPNEDFDAYPRDLDADAALCASAGVELIFAPTAAEIYPEGASTIVRVEGMTDNLCGPHRPGHFQGVATVVTKLLIITTPDVAVFGQKDYQQLAIIRRLNKDLHLGVEIVGAPTIREPDGLAMSSRNRYLDATQRAQATTISKGLALAWAAWQDGLRDGNALEAIARTLLEALPDTSIDYVEAVHPNSLAPLKSGDDAGCTLAIAIRLGGQGQQRVRLIDNLRLDQPLPQALKAHVES